MQGARGDTRTSRCESSLTLSVTVKDVFGGMYGNGSSSAGVSQSKIPALHG